MYRWSALIHIALVGGENLRWIGFLVLDVVGMPGRIRIREHIRLYEGIRRLGLWYVISWNLLWIYMGLDSGWRRSSKWYVALLEGGRMLLLLLFWLLSAGGSGSPATLCASAKFCSALAEAGTALNSSPPYVTTSGDTFPIPSGFM